MAMHESDDVAAKNSCGFRPREAGCWRNASVSAMRTGVLVHSRVDGEATL